MNDSDSTGERLLGHFTGQVIFYRSKLLRIKAKANTIIPNYNGEVDKRTYLQKGPCYSVPASLSLCLIILPTGCVHTHKV